jgi:hypothetical protein
MTATLSHWEQFGRDNPQMTRRELRDTLEAAGLVLNSRGYHLAFEAINRGRSEIERDRMAVRERAERERIAPYQEEARMNVLAWGCWQEQSPADNQPQFDADCHEEATRLADEAAESAEDAARTAEQDAADLLNYRERIAAVDACVSAAKASVADAGWRIDERKCGSESSRYFFVCRPDADCPDEEDVVLTLRISDHFAKNGSGWNEGKQDYHNEPDVNVVVRKNRRGNYAFDLSPLTDRLC